MEHLVLLVIGLVAIVIGATVALKLDWPVNWYGIGAVFLGITMLWSAGMNELQFTPTGVPGFYLTTDNELRRFPAPNRVTMDPWKPDGVYSKYWGKTSVNRNPRMYLVEEYSDSNRLVVIRAGESRLPIRPKGNVDVTVVRMSPPGYVIDQTLVPMNLSIWQWGPNQTPEDGYLVRYVGG